MIETHARCDRCGGVASPFASLQPIGIPEIGWVDVHLCPECIRAFVEWLKRRPRSAEGSPVQ